MFGAYAPGQGYFADAPIGVAPAAAQPSMFDACGSYVASFDGGGSYLTAVDGVASYAPTTDHGGSSTGE